jgi:hypothetical protein
MSDMKSFLHHINEAPKGEIYCDMDGVLVDIIGGIANLYGIKDLDNKNFDSYVNPLKPRIDKEHPHLFAELPWMKDGKQLWAYITNYNPNILSAHTSSWQSSSKQDKMKWIQKNLRPLPSTPLFQTPHAGGVRPLGHTARQALWRGVRVAAFAGGGALLPASPPAKPRLPGQHAQPMRLRPALVLP